MTHVWVFPGQGSQRVGMGADVFGRYQREVALADSVLDLSIERLCLEDPLQQLNQTEFTQPALFVVNALMYLARIDEGAAEPELVAGHSLGEYNALYAAGAFDFVTGVQLVQRRGALMGQARGGGMAAIVGLSTGEIDAVLREPRFSDIAVANYNSPSQVVVSGPTEQIELARDPLKQAGARAVLPLKTSAAFHSQAMASAAEEFRRFLTGIEFRQLQLPVIANVTARPYDPDGIGELLAEQITSPVRWVDSVSFLLDRTEREIEEIGPGKVLRGLIRETRAAASPATSAEA